MTRKLLIECDVCKTRSNIPKPNDPEAKILMGLGRWPMECSACNKKTLHRVIEVDI